MIVNIISYHINSQKTALLKDLNEKASDEIILKRRFRMISQLTDYESQIYKKIYNFQSTDVNDYVDAVNLVINELYNVTDKSG